MSFSRGLRQTLTIVRRDFTATVFTPAFLIFLLVPIIMFGMGPLIGMGAGDMVRNSAQKQRLVVIAAGVDASTIRAIDTNLRGPVQPGQENNGLPLLRIDAPKADTAAQAHMLFKEKGIEVRAVLYGPLDHPTILYAGQGRGVATYLGQLAEQSLRAERSGGPAPLSHATLTAVTSEKPSATGQSQTAFFATLALFVLNMMLSGQAVGTMAEERGNKVIEILAAAIPLECVFLGKLIAMFGSAMLFLAFWATILGNIAKLMPPTMATIVGSFGTAVGPAFPLLFFAYFALSYMLLGAVFLTVGAQASSPREIQMYSLPITIFMVLMFSFSLFASGHPGSWQQHAAEIFPFSSPFAMVARAASRPELWPHLLALGWQLLWVALTLIFGARWFRRGVLQSGSPRLKLRRKTG
jgi:ABC-2 type transport system permease protein